MANIFGYTTAQWRNDVKVHIDVIKRRKEEFNIGGLASGLRLRTMAQAVGSEIYFPEVGIDRVIKPVLEDYDQLKTLMKDNPKKNPVFLSVLQRGIDLKAAFPEMGIAMPVAGPFTNASCIRPVEKILRAIAPLKSRCTLNSKERPSLQSKIFLIICISSFPLLTLLYHTCGYLSSISSKNFLSSSVSSMYSPVA
jgi:hypothetical protein